MAGACRIELLGTAGSWFIFDVVFYANGLFSTSVLALMGYAGGVADRGELTELAVGQVILASMGLPGYLMGVLTVDRIGRRRMQLLGFTAVGVAFFALGGGLAGMQAHAAPLLIFIYGLTFFFANWGPNLTTFVIPAESFPTRVKASCHGLSAASGKLGAVVGAAGMSPLLGGDSGLQRVLLLCGALSMVGTLWTAVFTRESGQVHIADLDASDAADDTARAAADARVAPAV
jgi:PHS family inorganic phosphate transporter-like MFS transporter